MEEMQVTGRRSGRAFVEIASDPDAFERFYREHVEAVQRFVARRVDEQYLAADLTADVCKNLEADETLVITTQGGAGVTGPSSIAIAFAKGEVKPCEVVDAPAGSQQFPPVPAAGSGEACRGSGTAPTIVGQSCTSS